MLYEDDVVNAVAAFLTSNGWEIESIALANDRGDDIVATRGDLRLRIEAKGEGSSKEGTRRYGDVFTRNQVGSHVSVAVMRSLIEASDGTSLVAVAFPDNKHHHDFIDPAKPALDKAGIGVFWVSPDSTVSPESPWSIYDSPSAFGDKAPPWLAADFREALADVLDGSDNATLERATAAAFQVASAWGPHHYYAGFRAGQLGLLRAAETAVADRIRDLEA